MIELKSVVCDMDEQETTITFCRKENIAYVYSSDNTMLTKIQKLLNAPDSEWNLKQTFKDRDGNPTGYEFTVNKKMVSLRAKKKPGKELTEEERKALGERLRGSKSVSEDDEDADED